MEGQTEEQSKQYGMNIGEFFRALEDIDPVPILYTGTSLTANHVLNDHTFFHTAQDTRRYGKGNDHRHIPLLKALAEGFMKKRYSRNKSSGSEQKNKYKNVYTFTSGIRKLKMNVTWGKEGDFL